MCTDAVKVSDVCDSIVCDYPHPTLTLRYLDLGFVSAEKARELYLKILMVYGWIETLRNFQRGRNYKYPFAITVMIVRKGNSLFFEHSLFSIGIKIR
jgi:hypothetical protein